MNPLNAFQRTMLQWERLHPYNAVHALQVLGPARPDRLRLAVQDACAAAGLGKLNIDGRGKRCAFEASPEPALRLLPATARPRECLTSLLTSGTNEPFARPGTVSESPLRWSLFAEADATSHWVVLAYRHLVSDAHGVQHLLANTLAHYLGGKPGPTRLRADAASDLAGRRDWKETWRSTRALYGTFRALRCAHKMGEVRDADDRTECAVFAGNLDMFEPLMLACRRRGAGLNDACLAALASAIAERTQDRHTSRRRRKLALGSILSLRPRESTRPEHEPDPEDGALAAAPESRSTLHHGREVPFGPQLADMVILLDDPDASFDGLLAQIIPQTQAARRMRANEGGVSEPVRDIPAPGGSFDPRLFLVQRIWPLFRMPHHRRSYRKVFPICAGVSTFVADTQLFGPVADRILRYVRVAPPGPALPIVLAPTVFRSRLELTLTFRLATLAPDAAHDVLARVAARLQAFATEFFG